MKPDVALRSAALEFARLGPVKDSHDRAGRRANRKLLRAARRYAQEKTK